MILKIIVFLCCSRQEESDDDTDTEKMESEDVGYSLQLITFSNAIITIQHYTYHSDSLKDSVPILCVTFL